MGRIVFSENGIQVHLPNPETDPMFEGRGAGDDDYEEFEGRRPIIYNNDNRSLYVGAPNWWHSDLEGHHQLGYSVAHQKGYVQGGPHWGDGQLVWYGATPREHPEIAQSLESVGIPVPNKELWQPEEIEDDLWKD